ncbi:MAG: helix-turn-helix transcriptional regulator [Methermicoccaceae archaeon]
MTRYFVSRFSSTHWHISPADEEEGETELCILGDTGMRCADMGGSIPDAILEVPVGWAELGAAIQAAQHWLKNVVCATPYTARLAVAIALTSLAHEGEFELTDEVRLGEGALLVGEEGEPVALGDVPLTPLSHAGRVYELMSVYGLSQQEAEVWLLRREGHKNKEVAALLKITEGRASSYYSTARKKLQGGK